MAIGLTVTNVADVDRDPVSGRKLLNQYEIIDELGRGVHGKVKLGRNLDKNQAVAIKIVQRYSKRRRLGKLGDPEDNVKREVAILKKAIHPNVVALLEVIDDPAKKKVYIVLEYVELGEIEWRTKGVKAIIDIERRRFERESGVRLDGSVSPEEEARRQRGLLEDAVKCDTGPQHWSLEHGGGSTDEDENDSDKKERNGDSRPSRTVSSPGSGRSQAGDPWTSTEGLSTAPLTSITRESELAFSEFGFSSDGPRGQFPPFHTSNEFLPLLERPAPGDARTHSLTASFMSNHSTDIDYDPYDQDFSYVPCLTIDQARQAFRDTVLGLEYLHYQGIIHRDIKPANLLWTAEHRVKISDFGVSYLGRPIRDDDNGEDVSESDARPLDEAVELAKTVGTPAFYAPELCYTDLSKPRPPVTGQIDIWALGVTLYCLLFARIPFLAPDEFSLFKLIAEGTAYIPRRRLQAVSCPMKARLSPHKRSASALHGNYRRDGDLVYEDIDDDLYDLLKRILEKDPTKRITLKEVKRHPSTLHGIVDPTKWIEETDPARQYQGRKIEVSSEDVEKAVVPIGFLARVRSGMRKMGAAIGLGSSKEGRSRARSNAQSTDGTSSNQSTSPTPTVKDERRSSLKGDEAIPTPLKFSRDGEHPLAQSVTVTPDTTSRDPFFDGARIPSPSPGARTSEQIAQSLQTVADDMPRPAHLDRSISNSGESTRTIRPHPYSSFRRMPSPPVSPHLPGHAEDSGLAGDSSPFTGLMDAAIQHDGSDGPDWQALSQDHTTAEVRAPSLDTTHNRVEAPQSEPSIALSGASAVGHVTTPQILEGLSNDAGLQATLTAHTHTSDHALPHFAQPQPSIDRDTRRFSTSPVTSHWLTNTQPPSHPDVAFRHQSLSLPRLPLLDVTHDRDQRHSQLRLEIDKLEQQAGRVMPGPPQLQRDGDNQVRMNEGTESGSAEGVEENHAATSSNLGTPAFTPPPMISSSSEDHFNSGMSQSTSYPSVPSIVSAGSSVSADELALYKMPMQTTSPAPQMPPSFVDPFSKLKIMPTVASEDDAGYVGDIAVETDEDGDDSDGEDDVLVMSRRKTRVQAPLRSQSVSFPQLSRRTTRRGTVGSGGTDQSGSSGTVKKTLSNENEAGAEEAAVP